MHSEVLGVFDPLENCKNGYMYLEAFLTTLKFINQTLHILNTLVPTRVPTMSYYSTCKINCPVLLFSLFFFITFPHKNLKQMK